MNNDFKVINLHISQSAIDEEFEDEDEDDYCEEILVEQINDKTFKAMSSPGLVENLAEGDIFETYKSPKHTGFHFKIIKRSGNVCLQIYIENISVVDFEKHLLDIIESIKGKIGGKKIDNPSKAQYSITTHISNGLDKIEEAMNNMTNAYPSALWMYGNIYDPYDGKTPLNWWLD